MNYLATITGVIAFWLGFAGIALSDNSTALPDAIQHTRFITYTPRSFSIVAGKVVAASETGIRADLKLLRPWFNGLITYAANNGGEAVPEAAHDLGYRAVIMGIWDPRSETEIKNVIAAAKQYPTMIAAVVVGNEGIYTRRYLRGDIERAIQRIKQECPDLPTTTSEPFFLYFEKEYADLFSTHDLLMPIIHPVFEKWFNPSTPEKGVEMVIQVADKFRKAYDRPLLIKETGLPSGQEGHGFTAQRQAQFWSEISKRFPTSASQALACFEAFDAPWKPMEMAATFPGDHANEAFWGFFTAAGTPKPAINALPRLKGD